MKNSEKNSDSTEIKTGVVAQVCDGFLRRVAAGYRFAMRTYSGNIKVYSSPFVFRLPATEAKFICIYTLERTVTYSDAVKTIDNITVTCGSPIKYHFHINDDAVSIRKAFNEIEADQRINELVKDIIDLVVKNSKAEDIKNGFSISPTRIPTWLSPSVQAQIHNNFYIIRNKYGAVIENVLNVDFNEPKEILDAETKSKAAKIERETALNNARNDASIEMMKARIEYIKRIYNYDSLYHAVVKFHLSSQEVCELLKREFTKTNVTIIETPGGLDALTAAVLSGFKDYLGQAKSSGQQVNDNSSSITKENGTNQHSGFIDADYSDTDERSK